MIERREYSLEKTLLLSLMKSEILINTRVYTNLVMRIEYNDITF